MNNKTITSLRVYFAGQWYFVDDPEEEMIDYISTFDAEYWINCDNYSVAIKAKAIEAYETTYE